MKIKLNSDMELEVFKSVRQTRPKVEKFPKNTILEIDICDELEPPIASEIQFADGCISFVTEDFWKDVIIIEKD